jgi:hypothetical protein
MQAPSSPQMSRLLEALAAELERPRELSARVMNYIGGNYSVEHDAVGAFLVVDLPALEDYEIDLILSPAFTPKLADQAVFAELLGSESGPREDWPRLVEQLVARPTLARIVTPDSHAHPVPLREVTVERYMHRLRLEATIPASLLEMINREFPPADRPMLKAIARRAVWETEPRIEILQRYLAGSAELKTYQPADAIGLLDLVEGYKPADFADLAAWIPRRQDSLREQINTASGSKPFFSQQVEAMHGGARDQRRHEDAHVSAKQAEFDLLQRLQQVLTPPISGGL